MLQKKHCLTKSLYLYTNAGKVTPPPKVPGPSGCWTFGAAAAPAGTGREDASEASPPPPLEGEKRSETPEKSEAAKQHPLLALWWWCMNVSQRLDQGWAVIEPLWVFDFDEWVGGAGN